MLALSKKMNKQQQKQSQNKRLQAASSVLRVSVIQCKVDGISIWTLEFLKDPIRDIGDELVLGSGEENRLMWHP